jgi:hypothetical protein
VEEERQRLIHALDAPDPVRAVQELARVFRREGMEQVAMYRLFAEQQQKLSADDPRYDAVVDTMDLIWGGPWAKGHALFDEELTDARLSRE